MFRGELESTPRRRQAARPSAGAATRLRNEDAAGEATERRSRGPLPCRMTESPRAEARGGPRELAPAFASARTSVPGTPGYPAARAVTTHRSGPPARAASNGQHVTSTSPGAPSRTATVSRRASTTRPGPAT